MENFINHLLQATAGEGSYQAIINLATDLARVLDAIIFIFSWVGFFLFISAVWQFMRKDNANSNVSNKSISLKIIFGALLAQLSALMDDVTQSLWSGSVASRPEDYLALSAAEQSSANIMSATMYAVLAIVVFLGWVYGGLGVYKFATIGSKQDQDEAFWKATWTLMGATLLVNIALAAMDVSSTLSGVSPVIQAG
jgi:flagellar biogenesis protein FliO